MDLAKGMFDALFYHTAYEYSVATSTHHRTFRRKHGFTAALCVFPFSDVSISGITRERRFLSMSFVRVKATSFAPCVCVVHVSRTSHRHAHTHTHTHRGNARNNFSDDTNRSVCLVALSELVVSFFFSLVHKYQSMNIYSFYL